MAENLLPPSAARSHEEVVKSLIRSGTITQTAIGKLLEKVHSKNKDEPDADDAAALTHFLKRMRQGWEAQMVVSMLLIAMLFPLVLAEPLVPAESFSAEVADGLNGLYSVILAFSTLFAFLHLAMMVTVHVFACFLERESASECAKDLVWLFEENSWKIFFVNIGNTWTGSLSMLSMGLGYVISRGVCASSIIIGTGTLAVALGWFWTYTMVSKKFLLRVQAW